MKSKKQIYQKVEKVWTSAVLTLVLAAGLWTVTQFSYFLLGDLAYNLVVFNEPWKKATTSYCAKSIEGCQKVSFDQQLLTTSPSGPSWQAIGSRFDVNISVRPGAADIARVQFIDYVGAAIASHLTVNIVETKAGK